MSARKAPVVAKSLLGVGGVRIHSGAKSGAIAARLQRARATTTAGATLSPSAPTISSAATSGAVAAPSATPVVSVPPMSGAATTRVPTTSPSPAPAPSPTPAPNASVSAPATRKPATRAAFLLLAALVLASCTQRTASNFIPDDYRAWKSTTDEVLDYPIPGHDLPGLRKIFINDKGYDYGKVLDAGARLVDFPDGTLIVKEVYGTRDPAPGQEPVMLTAMYKDESHPMERGGWVWILKTAASNAEVILDEEFCFTCHNNANEAFPYGAGNPEGRYQDFVFFLPGSAGGSQTNNSAYLRY